MTYERAKQDYVQIKRASVQDTDYSAFGFNFADRVYEDWRWYGHGGYMDLLEQGRCEYVNLTAAAQDKEAFQRALGIQMRMPYMHILWRHMTHQPPGASDKTDKGMWRLPPHEFVDNVVLAHGYHSARFKVVTDCEGHIAAHELPTYAGMQAEVLDYGVPKGGQFAVLRMSTHHPTPVQLASGMLDPLLAAVGRNMGSYDDPKVVISNNGYFDDNNAFGLETASLIERRCIDRFGFRPVIVMGEYNYDRGLTSEGGPNAENMSAEVLVEKLVTQYNAKLRGKRVLVYCIGIGEDAKVKNFHLNNETARMVALNAPRFVRPADVPTPSPIPEPEPDPDDSPTEPMEPLPDVAMKVMQSTQAILDALAAIDRQRAIIRKEWKAIEEAMQ